MIDLVPMTEDEFQVYLDRAIPDYAQEKVRSGNWAASEALQKSKAEYDKLLPEGLSSRDQYLYTIVDPEAGARIGMLWLAVTNQEQEPVAFIYDLYIDPDQRRKGYGYQAMLALEERVKSFGIHHIRLHVFAHNDTARALYHRIGYIETNISMQKDLT